MMRYGADDAFPIADIDDILPGLIEQRSQILLLHGYASGFRSPRIRVGQRAARARRRRGASREFVALNHVLDDMRLYKSRAEQASLRRAAQIAVGAHRRAMRFARPGRMEYEVMAECCMNFVRTMPTCPICPSSAAAPMPASCITATTPSGLCDGDSAAAGCRLRARLLRIGHHAHVSGQWPIHARRSAQSTRWCSRRRPPPSTKYGREITGISRTRLLCGS
jgi:hypothetical protein